MIKPLIQIKKEIDRIDSLLYSFGILFKQQEIDPTTFTGFILLENLLTNKILSVTSKERRWASKKIKEVIASLDFDNLNSKQRREFEEKILKVIVNYGLKASNVVPPVILDGMMNIFKETKRVNSTLLLTSDLFSVEDQKAIKFLAKPNTLFIRDNFKNNVTKLATSIVSNELEDLGGARKFTGKVLAERLDNLMESRRYWNVFAAAALNNARTLSNLRSFEEAGVIEYEIVAMMDEKTTNICRGLNQRRFKVSDGSSTFNQIIEAESPDDFKDASPWINQNKSGQYFKQGGEKIELDTSKASNKFLISHGLVFPPFHGNCRTTIIPVL